jgi:ACS family 4-hydroxyphenylacetate permease-like MFS transporter
MAAGLGTDHSLIQLLGIIMASVGSFTAMAIFWTTRIG